MTRPVHNYLLAERLESETEIGGLHLPDTAKWETYDALVTAAGPGRLLDNGTLAPLLARVGDRVVFQKHQIRTALDAERKRVIVSDADLVAVIPGPDHAELLPAGEYVFVTPDRRETERPSGVIVAHESVGGARPRELLRRNELMEEYENLRARMEREREPQDEQVRKVTRWGQGLSPDDKRLVQDFLMYGEASEETIKTSKPPRRSFFGVQGTLVAVGPGKVERDGRRVPLPGALAAGQRVAWDKQHEAVELYCGGEMVLALKHEYLAAVEVP